MVDWQTIANSIFLYETPKIITIRSRTLGCISRTMQLAIIAYVVGYSIFYEKGYQAISPVESSLDMSVDGAAYTNFSDEEFDPRIRNISVYKRVWDVADLVVPPTQNKAVFIATNIHIASQQKRGVCPEDGTKEEAQCTPENNTCVPGTVLRKGNGIFTGKCVGSDILGSSNFSCEVHAWCPVENDIKPLLHKKPLLMATENFTLLIKNTIYFREFDAQMRNIKRSLSKFEIYRCLYDPVTNRDCPVFKVKDILKEASPRRSYAQLAYEGAIIEVAIMWDCNFDWSRKCYPTYRFKELTNQSRVLARGFDFRKAIYFSEDERTLFKMYGLHFDINVQGHAGKFSMVPLLLKLGAGLGLLVVQRVLMDILVIYLAKRRQYYRNKKYENVTGKSISEGTNAPAPQESPSSSNDLDKVLSGENPWAEEKKKEEDLDKQDQEAYRLSSEQKKE